MNAPWRIELFGGLKLSRSNGEVIDRFQTRKTAALLAYLAFYREKAVPRDVLAELFWPDNAPEASRNSLRVALTSLRRQVEPPGVEMSAVLLADRSTVQLNPLSFTTDVADFEAALRDELLVEDDAGRTEALLRAVDLYKGPLLTGWFEEWVDLEQARLAEVYAGALRRVTTLLAKAGDFERALDYAQHAVVADPLREETNRNLMRLFAILGQPAAAREQYRRLESLLLKEVGTSPSPATRELMKQIMSGADKLVQAAAAKGIHNLSPDIGPLVLPTLAAPAPFLPTPPAPNAMTAPRSVGNISISLTRFFGRETEIAQLEAALRRPGSPRLITLTGPGGTGKTRLAVETASRLRARFYEERVWLVSLADLTEASQIVTALLSALRLGPLPDTSPIDQLEAALHSMPSALLVLDNLEQAIEPAADVIAALLSRLPHLKILATSRQRLAVGGEQEFPVAPLAIPATTVTLWNTAQLATLAMNPSVALFLDRARAVRPDFQITARNAAPIAELARRLDGLPLALELAAAGVRLLSPQQLLDRLSENSTLLATERRDLAARHRSLRAVMDESYRLLPAEVCPFFARLSVFRGGWTLDAAIAVCDCEDALELLDALQQRSLIVASDTYDGIRFRFLETIRQYAESKLTPDDDRAARAAHARYFADCAQAEEAALRGPESDVSAERIEREHDNLRVALATLLSAEESSQREALETALRVSVALWRFWYAQGHAVEGLHVLHQVLALAGSRFPALEGRAHEGAGRLSLAVGNVSAAITHFNAARDLLEKNPDFDATALTMDCAIAAEALGDQAAAESAYRRLADLYRGRGDGWAEALAMASLAALLEARGETAEARHWQSWSDARRRAIGDGAIDESAMGEATAGTAGKEDPAESPRVWMAGPGGAEAGIAASFLQLGHVASVQGDYAVALPLLSDALAAYRRLGDAGGAAITQERIALTALRQNDLETAHRAAEEALLLRRQARTRRDSPPSSALDPVDSADPAAFAENLLREITVAYNGAGK